jgi:hypothetical protein
MALARIAVLPDEVKALARACSGADNHGDDSHWEMWTGFAQALFDSFPEDHVLITRRSYTQLSRAAIRADPDRMEAMDSLIVAARTVLRDFLDPHSRAIALGELARTVRRLDSIDFQREDRRGH